MVNGDAATVEALVVAGPRLIDVKDSVRYTRVEAIVLEDFILRDVCGL